MSLNLQNVLVDVVVGQANPYKEEIASLCADFSAFNFHCQVNNMAELMAEADLAIGAGGTTSWERCCIGLPTIIISVADNQEPIAKNIDKNGLGIHLGRSEEVTIEMISDKINKLLDHPEILMDISLKSQQCIDGYGVNRVVDRICEKII
jgi:UDP-2,4-diacetamido-2,4,6-trideoxy-beta-L-altropyranose hydrolase